MNFKNQKKNVNKNIADKILLIDNFGHFRNQCHLLYDPNLSILNVRVAKSSYRFSSIDKIILNTLNEYFINTKHTTFTYLFMIQIKIELNLMN